MARRYSFLRFEPGVDWKDVNQALLYNLNRLGMNAGVTITITSGYRTREHQAEIWARSNGGKNFPAAPPGLSQHESGNAIDATVNGVPLAKIYNDSALAKYGLATIYNKQGKRFDLVHIQLAGTTQTRGGKGGADLPPPSRPGELAGKLNQVPAQTPQTQTQLGAPSHPDLTIPSYLPTDAGAAPPQPEDTQPSALPPGTAPSEAWQQIVSQPGAHPLTVSYGKQVATSLGA